MKLLSAFGIGALLSALTLGVIASAQPQPTAERHDGQREPTTERRDGQHDFDFEIGAWKTHLRRLVHPLSGSSDWVELDGTTMVSKVWDGRANLAELTTDAASAPFIPTILCAANRCACALWSNITANSAHWEQAFSPDGGQSWEVNWITDFKRPG